MAFGKPPVIRPARKRTEFDYDFLSPEDRRRLEKPMVSLGKCNFKIFHLVECSSFFIKIQIERMIIHSGFNF